MGLTEKPRFTVLNKIDVAPGMDKNWSEEEALQDLLNNQTMLMKTCFCSAVKKWGLTALLPGSARFYPLKQLFRHNIETTTRCNRKLGPKLFSNAVAPPKVFYDANISHFCNF